MKRTNVRILLLALVGIMILMAPAVCPQTADPPNSYWGPQFGQLVSPRASPTRLYAVSGTFAFERAPEPFKSIFGGMWDEGEVTLMYSSGESPAETQELYGARFIGEQDISVWGGLYGTIGWGAWAFMNTDGGDIAAWSVAIQAGLKTGKYDIQLGGDWIPHDGHGYDNDQFWLYAGVFKDI